MTGALRLGFIGFGEACMKGLAAVLLESLEAAQRYGITDAVVIGPVLDAIIKLRGAKAIDMHERGTDGHAAT